MGVWNRAIECMDEKELGLVKIERLQATLNRVIHNVPFYRDLFAREGIVPEKVRSIGDLGNLPFTTRDDLVAQQPYGLFAVPLRDIARIHSSSGTTGRPVVVGYTKNDLAHWAEAIARLLAAAGVDDSDIVQISFSYGLFSGGFGFDLGSEHVGATIIPVSVSTVEQQIGIMRDYHTTCLFSTPSFAVQIANMMEEQGIRSQELSLKTGIFGAEHWSEAIRTRIETGLGIKAYDLYGISELMGPGVAGECQHKNGLHLWEDMFIAEIIDPESGKQLPAGEEGELVLTTLNREAMPLVRYRTGDITALHDKPCPCGRTHARLNRIVRKKADLLIVRGVNVYLRDIEDLFARLFDIPVRYQLAASRGPEGDNLEILIEVSDRLFADEMGKYRHMEATIRHAVAERLSFEPVVKFVEPNRFPPPGEDYPRLVDTRNIGI